MVTAFIQLYLGFILTAAGFSKLGGSRPLELLLKRLGIKSSKIRMLLILSLSLLEIFLGFALIVYGDSFVIGLINTLMFTGFLGVKIWLAQHREDDCGCFGDERKIPVDIASIAVTVIWLIQSTLVSSEVRFVIFAIYLMYVIFLGTSRLRQHRHVSRRRFL